MLVLNQFFIFVSHDPLLHFKFRAIRSHLGPKVSPLTDDYAQLQEINTRALGRQFDRVKLVHFGGQKQIPHTLPERMPSLSRFHELTFKFRSYFPESMRSHRCRS
jgi:hypothetical protein